MRYESFYPFTREQSSPFSLGQPSFGPPPQGNPSQPNISPFQGGNAPVGNGFGSPAQGSSRMETYMQTANRFLNTAQQYAPVVQQFAPMMQNLPAMWKLYKGFQSLPTSGAASSATQSSIASSSGISIPRIFQPPN